MLIHTPEPVQLAAALWLLVRHRRRLDRGLGRRSRMLGAGARLTANAPPSSAVSSAR